MSFDVFGDFETCGYLRNVYKLKDPAEIKELEHRHFRKNLNEAIRHLSQVKHITYQDVLDTHKILFKGMYPWAGQDRLTTAPNIGISKGGRDDLFAHPGDTQAAVDYALKLGQDKFHMTRHPGEVMGYLAHAHPFLDGNGRTIMVVHNELAHRAGISIDWKQTNKEAYIAALTQELDRPGKGELDDYLKPFIGRAKPREHTTAMLRELPGLGPDRGKDDPHRAAVRREQRDKSDTQQSVDPAVKADRARDDSHHPPAPGETKAPSKSKERFTPPGKPPNERGSRGRGGRGGRK